MRSSRTVLSLLLGALLATGAVLAAPVRPSDGPRAKVPAPAADDYVPAIDGPITTVQGPDGTLWGVWSYRASGEFDIALASRDASGIWSAPTFVGRRDGVDQQHPVLAVDAIGTLYLAYDTKSPSGVSVAVRPAGSATWIQPYVLPADPSASSPALRIVGNRLIVAFRTSQGVGLLDLPTLVPGALGIQDGPDSVDPIGMTGTGSGAPAPPGSGGDGGSGGSGGSSGGGSGGGSHK